MAEKIYDLLIVGAGPAGVSAALYAKSRGLDLLLLERNRVGGLIRPVSKVSHYTGLLPEEDGESFSLRLEQQLAEAGIEPHRGEAKALDKIGELFVVTTETEEIRARAVIAATGTRPKDLHIPGEKEYGASHEARIHAEACRGKTALVCGGSDGAAKEALFLSKYASEVLMIQDQEKPMMIAEFREAIDACGKIRILCGTKLAKIEGDGKKATRFTLQKTDGSTEVLEREAARVFVFIGQTPELEWISAQTQLEGGFIRSEDGKTPCPGLFAAGDCRSKTVRQISTAVADGTLCAIYATQYLAAQKG